MWGLDNGRIQGQPKRHGLLCILHKPLRLFIETKYNSFECSPFHLNVSLLFSLKVPKLSVPPSKLHKVIFPGLPLSHTRTEKCLVVVLFLFLFFSLKSPLLLYFSSISFGILFLRMWFFAPSPCVFKTLVVQYLCTLECDVSYTNCLHGGVIKWMKIKQILKKHGKSLNFTHIKYV